MADEEQEESQETKETIEDQGGGRKKIILIVVIAVVVLAAGAGAAMFLMGGEETPTLDQTTVEDSNPEEQEEQGEKKEQTDGEESSEETPETTPGEEGSEKKDQAKDDDIDIGFGDTYAMKTFNLNLGNPLENRFVRLEVTLEFSGGGKQKKEIEKRLPQLRDAVINVVSRKTREFLLAPDGKDALRKEVLIRINRYMKQKVDSVYITDILIE